MKFRLLVLCGTLLIGANGIAQDVSPQVRQMKSAYASSGGIVLLDDHTLLIQPNMPGPICGLPKQKMERRTGRSSRFLSLRSRFLSD